MRKNPVLDNPPFVSLIDNFGDRVYYVPSNDKYIIWSWGECFYCAETKDLKKGSVIENVCIGTSYYGMSEEERMILDKSLEEFISLIDDKIVKYRL